MYVSGALLMLETEFAKFIIKSQFSYHGAHDTAMPLHHRICMP